MIYGLDIGGTKIEISIFTAQFQFIERWRVPTPLEDYQQFLLTVKSQIEKADQISGQRPGVGIALPGVVDPKGLVISSNVACLNQRQVEADLVSILQRPVALGNDCRLFVLSEALLGAGQGYRRVFGAILGTGAGGGFTVDGVLQHGEQQIAGEFGHQAMSGQVLSKYRLPLYQCGCGLQGCAETYISGKGLARLYQHFTQQTLTTYDWILAYRAGDAVATHTFACYMDALGACMASQVLAYDPDVMIFGGGLSDIPEIIAALPEAISRHLFNGAKVPPLKKADFGSTSGGRGAAILASRAALQSVSA